MSRFAIVTTYQHATSTRPHRITAVCDLGVRNTIEYPEANPGEDAHRLAASVLRDKHGLAPGCRMECGLITEGTYAWVFIATKEN
jgi:hypothetical protein